MKGKWAKGIAPRFFAWIIKDKLAVSERPGGYARNHRRVRRQEEILWLRGEGFTRVVSLLTSPHNLHAYDELDMAWAHIPFGPHDDPHLVLPDMYAQLREWMAAGEQLLVHQEELSDRLMGVVAGYLRWSGLVPAGPQAISVVERIMHRQMGPDGRELVAMAPQLAGAGGCGALVGVRTRANVSAPPGSREPVAPAAAATAAVTKAPGSSPLPGPLGPEPSVSPPVEAPVGPAPEESVAPDLVEPSPPSEPPEPAYLPSPVDDEAAPPTDAAPADDEAAPPDDVVPPADEMTLADDEAPAAGELVVVADDGPYEANDWPDGVPAAAPDAMAGRGANRDDEREPG